MQQEALLQDLHQEVIRQVDQDRALHHQEAEALLRQEQEVALQEVEGDTKN